MWCVFLDNRLYIEFLLAKEASTKWGKVVVSSQQSILWASAQTLASLYVHSFILMEIHRIIWRRWSSVLPVRRPTQLQPNLVLAHAQYEQCLPLGCPGQLPHRQLVCSQWRVVHGNRSQLYRQVFKEQEALHDINFSPHMCHYVNPSHLDYQEWLLCQLFYILWRVLDTLFQKAIPPLPCLLNRNGSRVSVLLL